MATLIAFAIWIVFATVFAVVARHYIVKWAERKGWTALTMPMAYHIWLIAVYLIVVQVVWIILYAWLIA